MRSQPPTAKFASPREAATGGGTALLAARARACGVPILRLSVSSTRIISGARRAHAAARKRAEGEIWLSSFYYVYIDTACVEGREGERGRDLRMNATIFRICDVVEQG